jgi:hypothetical protein
MLIRYRWYRVQFPSDYVDLPSIIAGKGLMENASFGFTRIEGPMGSEMFRFLYRSKVTVTLFDDDGVPSYEEIASVNFTDFAMISIDDASFLRLENPSRNARDLLNALESLIGLGFTCNPLTFKTIKPTTIFEKVESSKLIGLKVVGAVINNDLVARMEFASKQGMVIEDMKLLDDLRYNVSSSVFEMIFEGIRGQVTFASSGLVKISGQLAPMLVYLIEQDLPRLS